MQNTTIPAPPALTLTQLRHIRQEVTAARQELLEMIEIADFRAIWNEPRKYFVPEIGSRIPFANGHLNRLVQPVWSDSDIEDPVRRAVVKDIYHNVDWLGRAREEFLRERFKKEEDDQAPASERSSCFW